VLPLPNGFAAIVADVCGKGIPAALLASMVQGMFQCADDDGGFPAGCGEGVNGFVFRGHRRRST